MPGSIRGLVEPVQPRANVGMPIQKVFHNLVGDRLCSFAKQPLDSGLEVAQNITTTIAFGEGRCFAGIESYRSESLRGISHSRSSIRRYIQSSYLPSAPGRAGGMRCSLPSMSRITVHSRLGASSPQAGHSTSVVRIPPHPHRMYWLHSANHDWPSESDLYHKRSILPKRSMTTKKAHQAGPVQCTQRAACFPTNVALGKKSPSFRTMSPESITSGAAWLIGNEGCSAQHGSGRGERSGPPN